ncbi:MAG: site-specific integrase [Desulfobacteraceae bacterium]|nr:MAG: site-specific integrase [Desulfobacteraceae bacterium]
MACVTKKRGKLVIDFYDQHGKRRLKTLPKGTTKTQARKVLREIEEQVDKRTFLPAKKIPLFSEVAKDWIAYKKPNLRETTWEVYQGHVKNHFHDLASVRINRITTAMVEKFIRTRQEQGLHILTLRKILVTLGQIFNYAVRHKYIEYNPVREAERPRGQGSEAEGKSKITILTPEKINSLLDEVKDQKYGILFMLAIFSGARQGELLGLKWKDVDWENSQIHIQRTFNKGRFFTTKTKGSNRKVDLGPTVLTELKKWKLACPKTELDLVFPNDEGKPMNYSNMMNRHFIPALEAAELPRIRFHDLRHTMQV